MTKCLRQIREIQLELDGIMHCVLDVDIVDRMLNTLLLSYDHIYQQISGLNVLLIFHNTSVRLIQAETCGKMHASIVASN